MRYKKGKPCLKREKGAKRETEKRERKTESERDKKKQRERCKKLVFARLK